MNWQALLPALFNNPFPASGRRFRVIKFAVLPVLRAALLAMFAPLTPGLALPIFDLELPMPGDLSSLIGEDLAIFLPVFTPPVSGPYGLAFAAPVYAVENIRCEGVAGAWALVYEGRIIRQRVTQQNNTAISLRLSRRIGFRYHPDYEGVDNSDWWCIPKKRFCYSDVEFTDWGGSYRAESVVAFNREQVFPASAGLELSLLEKISAKCP